MDRYRVWEIFSYAWTEIGIDDDECRSLVRKGAIGTADLGATDRIFFRDVCASFAVDSILVFPTMGMMMPDWGYDDEYLQRRMERWYAAPYWSHFLNPLRVLGYPVALLFAWRYRSRLRRAVRTTAFSRSRDIG